jgi:hypothetical protein
MLTRLKRKLRVIFPSAVKISGSNEPWVRNWMGTIGDNPWIWNWMSTIGDDPWVRNWMGTIGDEPWIWNWMSTIGDDPWIWNWMSSIGDEPWIWDWMSSVRYQPRIRNWMGTVGHDRCRARFCTVCIRDVGAKCGAYEQESKREQDDELNRTHEASSELLGPGDGNSRRWKIHE